MSLTNEEKSLLREIICDRKFRMGYVTPEELAAYAEKTDEEIRSLIVDYQADKEKLSNLKFFKVK